MGSIDLGFWSVVWVLSIVFGRFSNIMQVLLNWFEFLFGWYFLLIFCVSFCMEGVNLFLIRSTAFKKLWSFSLSAVDIRGSVNIGWCMWFCSCYWEVVKDEMTFSFHWSFFVYELFQPWLMRLFLESFWLKLVVFYWLGVLLMVQLVVSPIDIRHSGK